MFKQKSLLIKQTREMLEVISSFETVNKYVVYDEQAKIIGHILEKSSGFWDMVKRNLFKSHRPFEIHISDEQGSLLLTLHRSFYFFFSNLAIHKDSQLIGRVRRRFKILGTRYDFENSQGETFASIQAGFWRIWKFPIYNKMGLASGEILKKWRGLTLGGILTEAFTDADTFLINFGDHHWSEEQKQVIVSAAIAVDFDHFENNSQRN